MKDNEVGDKELLVARGNKKCRKIYRRMWYVPKDEKQNRSNGREFKVEQSSGKNINISNSGLHYKVTSSSWERCNPSDLWQVVQDNTLCGNLSGAVHTGVKVHRIYSEMSRLVERPWLQLMCCAVCLPHGHNFRWRREVRVGVSAEWCVAVEHQRLSSIRGYLCRLSD